MSGPTRVVEPAEAVPVAVGAALSGALVALGADVLGADVLGGFGFEDLVEGALEQEPHGVVVVEEVLELGGVEGKLDLGHRRLRV